MSYKAYFFSLIPYYLPQRQTEGERVSQLCSLSRSLEYLRCWENVTALKHVLGAHHMFLFVYKHNVFNKDIFLAGIRLL